MKRPPSKTTQDAKLYSWISASRPPVPLKPAATLTSQTTKYTCGPASLRSAARIFGIEVPESTLSTLCRTTPSQGTCHNDLLSVARSLLPVKAVGPDTYAGGLAIANIRNQLSKGGHYVLLLAKQDDYYQYFCPKIGAIVVTHVDDLAWRNASGTLHNWSLSFDCPTDVANLHFKTEGLMSPLSIPPQL